MKGSSMVVYEHSAAVSNIHIDNMELITDDYDGVVILRNLRTYKRFNKMFKRHNMDWNNIFQREEN